MTIFSLTSAGSASNILDSRSLARAVTTVEAACSHVHCERRLHTCSAMFKRNHLGCTLRRTQQRHVHGWRQVAHHAVGDRASRCRLQSNTSDRSSHVRSTAPHAQCRSITITWLTSSKANDSWWSRWCQVNKTVVCSSGATVGHLHSHRVEADPGTKPQARASRPTHSAACTTICRLTLRSKVCTSCERKSRSPHRRSVFCTSTPWASHPCSTA